MIRTLATDYTVRELCEAFEVSRSGYYAWRRGGRGKRARANVELSERIARIHAQNRGHYGSPRITHTLADQGIRCGHNRVARLMRERGIRGVQRGRFRPRTTDSRHDGPIAPHRLRDGANLTKPNQVWVSDITYIPTKEGWTYLSAFMDLRTRAIKGWALKRSLRTELILQAFEQAVSRHEPAAGLIVHSDRGIQYASETFRRRLAQLNILPSMGRTGHCYDNAAIESFWATLKTELHTCFPFKSKEHAQRALFNYIETYYNRRRLHSAIGYQTPLNYEAQLNTQKTVPDVSEISG